MSKVFQSWTGFIKSWVLCHNFYGTYLLQTYCGWNAALSPQPTHNSTSVSSVSDYIDSILDSSDVCLFYITSPPVGYTEVIHDVILQYVYYIDYYENDMITWSSRNHCKMMHLLIDWLIVYWCLKQLCCLIY